MHVEENVIETVFKISLKYHMKLEAIQSSSDWINIRVGE